MKGTTTFRTPAGETHTVTFADDLTDQASRHRLRTALECIHTDSIAHWLLAEANDYLLALRRSGDTDAAGLVVCVDCDHADQVASFMQEEGLVKERPVVAVSRVVNAADPEPADAIRKFKTSHAPWIVAVNMVSEGIDIRRLRAVVYLTNRTTLMAFRQIVGRVVRTDEANDDDHGRVYIPAEPRLLELAQNIAEEAKILPPPMTIIVDQGTEEYSLMVKRTVNSNQWNRLVSQLRRCQALAHQHQTH